MLKRFLPCCVVCEVVVDELETMWIVAEQNEGRGGPIFCKSSAMNQQQMQRLYVVIWYNCIVFVDQRRGNLCRNPTTGETVR